MSKPPPPEISRLESSALSGTAELVREGLSQCRMMPTPGQERRLAKTLERLQPAAHIALAGVAGQDAATGTGKEFSTVLFKLSHA